MPAARNFDKLKTANLISDLNRNLKMHFTSRHKVILLVIGALAAMSVPLLFNTNLLKKADVRSISNLDGWAFIDADGMIKAELDGTYIRIDDQFLGELRAIEWFQELTITNSTITDAGLRYLSNAHRLNILVLDNSQASDTSLSIIAKLPALKELSVQNTRITKGAVDGLKTLLPNLIVRY